MTRPKLRLARTIRKLWAYAFRFFRMRFRPSRARLEAVPRSTPRKILVVGIIMADRKNLASTLISDFGSARNHDVRQRWASLFGGFEVPAGLEPGSIEISEHPATPRSKLLNALVLPEDLQEYDYIIICDDDVLLPEQFLDDYIDLVEAFDFSLSQPARTWYSFISHRITKRDRPCLARATRFVEIGPLVCIRRDAFDLVFPIPEESGMGWGLDYVWAHLLERHDKRRGIIDALPIDHSIRRTGRTYSSGAAQEEMRVFLGMHPHLSKADSMQTIERHLRP
ncbi:MAG: hypothetical protein JJT88_12265 [Gammaproteobacteria bacterium]|nr:hypothetical protein [Gammaproteobacteria bacterium]